MKLVLIGTGKMGNAIAEMAESQGHKVVLKINEQNKHLLRPEELSGADMAIEFTNPASAAENLLHCLEANIPVVCGTTGWLDNYETIKTKFTEKNGALLYSSNFSIGMNLLFEMNRLLAGWMKTIPGFKAEITETHHIHKLDKPSGTAISLAGDILSYHAGYKKWVLANDIDKVENNHVPIYSKREDDVIGIHKVTWQSPIDKISLEHEAFSREGFAAGVLKAAEWLNGKKGVFSMKDVLFQPHTMTIS